MRRVVWANRIAFSLVFILNVQCALQFAFAPGDFVAAYELSGTAGEAAVRGLGIAFLMWNATYPAFIASPQRFPVLGWIIIAQQAIGLCGETALLFSLPARNDILATSVMRFIAFDAVGLVLMGIAWAAFQYRLTKRSRARRSR